MPHATAIEDIPAIPACVEALHGLLRRTAELRPYPGFKRALTEAELKNELDVLFGPNREEPGELVGLNKGTVLDTAFKRTIYGILARNKINDPGFSQIWHLLDIANLLCYRDQAESSLTMTLVEELFESQTTEGCRVVFEYLEKRQDMMFKKSWRDKQQITLRVCNELLRRFSRADNSIFCGRIFIYLFQVFPLGDRSSVNLRGTYHVENKTLWDDATKEAENEEIMEIDEEKTAETMDTTTQITITPAEQVTSKTKEPAKEVLDLDTLYPIFWSLQDYFSNPKTLFDAANLTLFKAGLEATLAKFQEIQKGNDSRPSTATTQDTSPGNGTKRKWSDLSDESTDEPLSFNPKYLTSRDLFALEVSSITFRRHVLVQALIILEFLLLQTASGRAKQNTPILDPAHPDKPFRLNASAVYAYELPEAEETWATSKRSEIAAYLSHGNEGRSYYRMVDNVLSRDKNWVIWKAHSCQEFVLPPLSPQIFLDAQKSAIKTATMQRLKAAPMGAVDMSFLNDPEGIKVLEQLRNPSRAAYPPTMEKLEEQFVDIDFDLANAERKAETLEAGEAVAEDEDEDPSRTKSRLIDMRDCLKWKSLRAGIRRGRLKYFDRVDGDAKMEALFRDPPVPVVAEKAEEEESKIEDDAGMDEEKENGENRKADEDGDVDVEADAAVDADITEEKSSDNIKAEEANDEIVIEMDSAKEGDTLESADGDVNVDNEVPAETADEPVKGEPIAVFSFDDDR